MSDRFYPVEHDGITLQLPSVTTILSAFRLPGIERWRGEVGNWEADRVMNEAATLGSEMHALAAAVNRGEEVRKPRDPVRAWMLTSYREWFAAYVREVIAVELPVYSLKYHFAGTLDVVLKLKGDRKPTLADIKTGDISGDMLLLHGWQSGGYALAYKEYIGGPIGRRVLIHIDKASPGKSVTVKDLTDPDDETGFLYLAHLWRKQRGGKLNAKTA